MSEDIDKSAQLDIDAKNGIEILKGFLAKDFTIDPNSIADSSSLKLTKPIKKQRKIKQLNKFLTSEADLGHQQENINEHKDCLSDKSDSSKSINTSGADKIKASNSVAAKNDVSTMII
eukprot:TRINITY_DN12757_c0_g4_i1.p3 TRINITY_DN12757_c0_g4~~TRINITY_DN12757_c0_g4_i1.p3  ORF type:complete len:118 (-),score=19.47 TRINITY_DN12757_c0_g4_i1:934-1287(-)